MSVAHICHAVADLSEFERGNLTAWFLDSLPPQDAEDGFLAARQTCHFSVT
jgi:hypothetical protein